MDFLGGTKNWMKMPHHSPQIWTIMQANSRAWAVSQDRGQAQQAVRFPMATVLLHLNRLCHFLSLVTHCLELMLPLHLWSSTGHWDFIMDGQLNMLEIKSANIGRAEGSQVKVSIVFMCLTDISHCHSVGIMEASFVGSCLTEFHNKAIFGYKLCHSFLTQQLKEKKKKEN